MTVMEISFRESKWIDGRAEIWFIGGGRRASERLSAITEEKVREMEVLGR